MNSSFKGLIFVGLVAFAMLTVGCGSEHEKQIAKLKTKNNELSAQKIELQGQLSRAQLRETKLQKKLDEAMDLLAQARAKVRSLENREPQQSEPRMAPAPAEKKLYERTLETDVLFKSGSATLSSKGKEALADIVPVLKDRYSDDIVRVYGFTDSDPIKRSRKLWKDNLDLSANRAMAVTRYLRKQGVDAQRVETVAMGKTRPRASNKKKAGKAQNRRVEIIVIQK